MKITTRQTRNFIELKVDETEVTIHSCDPKEIEQTIFNMISVAEDLAEYTSKSLNEFITEYNS